ncbi:hypothetical protein [Anaerocolumna xylanovorans]|nr:hypothetical protein [Anaerocolumna xylanovorans]
MKKHLRNDRGDMTFTTCFIMLALVMLVSFLLLFSTVKINSINIRNSVKMELNNLSASIYADTYRSQRETNMAEYIHTLYSSSTYIQRLEEMAEDDIAENIPLETEDYRIKNIRLEFVQDGDGIEYIFSCNAEFYVTMFGNRYPVITREIRLTGHHNTKF